MKNAVMFGLVFAVLILFFGLSYFMPVQEESENAGYATFSSCEQMKSFINESQSYDYYLPMGRGMETLSAVSAPMAVAEEGATQKSSDASTDYSETNIQVEGVDEADIVKTDGNYIYVLSGQKLSIIDAYPAEDAEVVSEIDFEDSPQEIFISGDKLVVFGQSSYYEPYRGEPMPFIEEGLKISPSYNRYEPRTFIYVYDVKNQDEPELVRNVTVEGNYYDSRMIGNYVYVIVDKYADTQDPVIPRIYSSDGERPACTCTDVGYFGIPDYSYKFTTILSVNTQNDEEDEGSDVYLMGYGQNMYVSENNIYLTSNKNMDYWTYQKRMLDEVVKPMLPFDVALKLEEIMDSNLENYQKWDKIGELMQDYFNRLTPEEKEKLEKEGEDKLADFQKSISKEMEKTIIHKIEINGKEIRYGEKSEVPGYVLNQFSMDENEGYFRIATTTGNWETEDYNHVYVLDQDLKIVGKLEDLAKGERIKSARFIDDRCYLVTFVQTDPLFVIDLSDPENPEVLGELKVSGYSSYLHPYDEDHLIGIGKETEEGRWGPIETGVKLALFDVSDVSDPKQVSKYVISGGWAHTPVMEDHKAFLFDREKNLLVIPAQISGQTLGFYNEWQGAYVFDLTLEKGFELKGRISHYETKEKAEENEYWYDYNNYVKRSLYIDDVLYTISNNLVKMNRLDNLDEIKNVKIY